MVKVLTDSETSWNLGDMAMVESGITEFVRAEPRAEVHLIHCIKAKSELHGVPRVHSITAIEVAGRWFSAMDRRFVWRFARQYQSALFHLLFKGLGKTLSAGSIPIRTEEQTASTMGRFCSQFDALYLSGGGYLTGAFPVDILRKCALILAFAEQGKPVMLSGQQIGPFRDKAAQSIVLRSLAKCSFVGLREPAESVAYCATAGLDNGRYSVIGDDSFGVPPTEPYEIDRLLARYGVQRGKFIAINLRTGWYARSHAQHLPMIAELTKALIRQFGVPVLVVPIALSGRETDIQNGEALAAMTGDSRVRVMQADGLNPSTARGVLGCAIGAVGVSYHFCTFALTEGVPAICIYDDPYYQQKARGIAAFWQDERLALSLAGLQVETALSHIRDVFEDPQIRARLAQRSCDAQRVWHEGFQRAVNQCLKIDPAVLTVAHD